MNFNFSFNSTFGNHKNNSKKLTAQEEYWLDRILRNHSSQIFIIIALFIAMIIVIVVSSASTSKEPIQPGYGSQIIQMDSSGIRIYQ